MSTNQSYSDNIANPLSRSFKSDYSKNADIKRPCYCAVCKCENTNTPKQILNSVGKQFTVSVESPNKILPCTLSVSSEAHCFTNDHSPNKIYKTIYSCCCCCSSPDDNYGKSSFKCTKQESSCCQDSDSNDKKISYSSNITKEQEFRKSSSQIKSFKAQFGNQRQDSQELSLKRNSYLSYPQHNRNSLCTQISSIRSQSIDRKEDFSQHVGEALPKSYSASLTIESFTTPIIDPNQGSVRPREYSAYSKTESIKSKPIGQERSGFEADDSREYSTYSKTEPIKSHGIEEKPYSAYSKNESIKSKPIGQERNGFEPGESREYSTYSKTEPIRSQKIEEEPYSTYSKTESYKSKPIGQERRGFEPGESKEYSTYSKTEAIKSQGIEEKPYLTYSKTESIKSKPIGQERNDLEAGRSRENSTYSKTAPIKSQGIEEKPYSRGELHQISSIDNERVKDVGLERRCCYCCLCTDNKNITKDAKESYAKQIKRNSQLTKTKDNIQSCCYCCRCSDDKGKDILSENGSIIKNETHNANLKKSIVDNRYEVTNFTKKADINGKNLKRACLCTCCNKQDQIQSNDIPVRKLNKVFTNNTLDIYESNKEQNDSRNFKRPCLCHCCPNLHNNDTNLNKENNEIASTKKSSNVPKHFGVYPLPIDNNKRPCLCHCCPTVRDSNKFNKNNNSTTRIESKRNNYNEDSINRSLRPCCCLGCSKSSNAHNTKSNKQKSIVSESLLLDVSNGRGNNSIINKTQRQSNKKNHKRAQKTSSKKKKYTKPVNTPPDKKTSIAYESLLFENYNNREITVIDFKRPCCCICCPHSHDNNQSLFKPKLNAVNNNNDKISCCCICCPRTCNYNNSDVLKITSKEQKKEDLNYKTKTPPRQDEKKNNTKVHNLKRSCCCVCCPKSNNTTEIELNSEIIKGSEGDNNSERLRKSSIKRATSAEDIKPGQGLLNYSQRLSTFCKRVDSKQEMLFEVPKNAKPLPTERPENHKLSFVDDPPYSNTIKLEDYNNASGEFSSSEYDYVDMEVIDSKYQCCQCCKCQHTTDQDVNSNRFYTAKPLEKCYKGGTRSSIEVNRSNNNKISKSPSGYVYYRYNLPQWIINHPTRKR